MASRKLVVSVVCLAALLVASSCVQPTEEDHTLYSLLQVALVNGSTNGVPNLYILEANFFPSQGQSPICMPVNYTIFCNSDFGSCLEENSHPENISFLWTQYDVTLPIGGLLLSYASSGIILKGFDWEDSCIYSEAFRLDLTLDSAVQFDDSAVASGLLGITSQLKAYAQTRGVPKVGDDNNGYAIRWDDEAFRNNFENSSIVLTVEVVVLNIFICFLSIAMTNYSYDILYENVKGKKNPGYPIFWGVVAFTLCWNVAPSWLVLSRYTSQTLYSLAIMIPLQFFVAFLVKKKAHFPIPFMTPHRCIVHTEPYFTFSKDVLCCARCLISHSLQVLAIWSVLTFLTFLIYYLSAIIVAFYLSPSVTLIKAIFLKGILLCAILNFALMFSVSQFRFKLSMNACKNNFASAISLTAVIMFLPILAFLAFIIGGILFSPQYQPSALQSIITLIPTGFLLIVAWISKGRLFPEGLHDPTDPAKEIASDLEKGALSDKDSKPRGPGGSTKPAHAVPTSRFALNKSTSNSVRSEGELSNYGAVDRRSVEPAESYVNGYDNEDEEKALV